MTCYDIDMTNDCIRGALDLREMVEDYCEGHKALTELHSRLFHHQTPAFLFILCLL
jgi:hypothetical protein